MSCYSVFLKENDKQIRVFSYDPLVFCDFKRARKLAKDFANKQAKVGHPCIVELFTAAGNTLIYDTDLPNE